MATASGQMQEEVLRVRGLNAWYGDSHVLHGVNLMVRRGELVTLLGRNGSGRTTILKSLLGLVSKREGSIVINGIEMIGLRTFKIVRFGKIGYCPEERGIFPNLSVSNNLILPPKLGDTQMEISDLDRMFPNLVSRRQSLGAQLSGGEQQMLAIARILRTGAKLLLLDEITEGLAPVIVQAIADTISLLKKRGFTIILVDQNFHFVSKLADRHYLVESGAIVDTYDAEALERNLVIVQRRLSV